MTYFHYNGDSTVTAAAYAQVADEMALNFDRLMSSLSLQRQSFDQQMTDAQQLINDSADKLCRVIESERRRLLDETNNIHHNTVTELDEVYIEFSLLFLWQLRKYLVVCHLDA